MYATDPLIESDADTAEQIWRAAANSAACAARQLVDLGVHKQVVNRLLEPFSWVDVVVTSSTWSNFFRLRLAPDAQPEMRRVAEVMQQAIKDSVPSRVEWGHWHLPAITEEDRGQITELEDLLYTAAGRLARVSYERSATRPWEADRDLARTLITSGHWSPFEHLARAREGRADTCRNFVRDWEQYRGLLE